MGRVTARRIPAGPGARGAAAGDRRHDGGPGPHQRPAGVRLGDGFVAALVSFRLRAWWCWSRCRRLVPSGGQGFGRRLIAGIRSQEHSLVDAGEGGAAEPSRSPRKGLAVGTHRGLVVHRQVVAGQTVSGLLLDRAGFGPARRGGGHGAPARSAVPWQHSIAVSLALAGRRAGRHPDVDGACCPCSPALPASRGSRQRTAGARQRVEHTAHRHTR